MSELHDLISGDPTLSACMPGKVSPGYLIRFLRAGRWEVESAVEILRAYSALGKAYTHYVSRAVPSRWRFDVQGKCYFFIFQA